MRTNNAANQRTRGYRLHRIRREEEPDDSWHCEHKRPADAWVGGDVAILESIGRQWRFFARVGDLPLALRYLYILPFCVCCAPFLVLPEV